MLSPAENMVEGVWRLIEISWVVLIKLLLMEVERIVNFVTALERGVIELSATYLYAFAPLVKFPSESIVRVIYWLAPISDCMGCSILYMSIYKVAPDVNIWLFQTDNCL